MKTVYEKNVWNYDGGCFYADMWRNDNGTDHIVLLTHPITSGESYGQMSTSIDFVANTEDMAEFVAQMAEFFTRLSDDYKYVKGER